MFLTEQVTHQEGEEEGRGKRGGMKRNEEEEEIVRTREDDAMLTRDKFVCRLKDKRKI